LGAGMWAVTHFKSGWRRGVTIAALIVGLVAIGALRFWFLYVTAGDVLAALLESVALTVFTTMIVWLGVLVLGFTKSRAVSAAERAAYQVRRSRPRSTAPRALFRAGTCKGRARGRGFEGRTTRGRWPRVGDSRRRCATRPSGSRCCGWLRGRPSARGASPPTASTRRPWR